MGAATTMTGQKLAADAQIVVVNINYRLALGAG